jgi:hypothetical protein
MSTNALDTQGTKLYIESTGSPEDRALITERVKITGPNETRPRRDVTDLDSTRREYKGGLRDSGEIQLEIFYVPSDAVHVRLRAAFNETDSTLRQQQWELGFTDGTTWRFRGEVSGWSQNFDVDSDVKATLTIIPSGDITEATP